MVGVGEVAALGVVAAGGTYLAVGVRARRYREAPAAVPFVAAMLTVGLSAIVLAAVGVALPTDDPFVRTAVALWIFLPVPWGIFALTYAGLRRLVNPWTVGAVTAWLGAATVVSLFDPGLVDGTPVWLVLATVQWGAYIVASALALVGATVVLRAAWTNPVADTRSTGFLVLAGIAPWLTVFFTGLFVPFGVEVALTQLAVGIALGAAAAVLAVERYGAFETTLAAGTLGRSAVIAELDETVLVADERGRIVDLNEAAGDAFDVDPSEVTGRSVREVIGVDLSTIRSSDVLELHTHEGHREFSASISAIDQGQDEPMGHAILLRDVTIERTRQQRLEVLNRVLRHNLRNDMNVVEGYAKMAGENVEGDRSGEYLDRIEKTASTLADLGEKAREIEHLVTAPRVTDHRRSLSSVVDAVVSDLREEYPNVAFRAVVDADTDLQLNPTLVDQVVRQLVENAAEHNDADRPRVEVRVAAADDPDFPLAITVADNGPGIPDQEWSVVVTGDETPLEHGSGLGLWMVNWGVTRLGGQVEYVGNEPRGSLVTVTLPEPIDDESVSSSPAAAADPADWSLADGATADGGDPGVGAVEGEAEGSTSGSFDAYTDGRE